MLYSRIEDEASCYISLHAEEVLRSVRESGSIMDEKNHTQRQVTAAPFLELVEEMAGEELLILDFLDVDGFCRDAAAQLVNTLVALMDETRICLIHMAADVKEQIAGMLAHQGILATFLPQTGGGYWGELPCEKRESRENDTLYVNSPLHEKTICRLVTKIKESNLFILMENGSQGRYFDIPRLLADGERCMYYFFYCLAEKMIREALVPGKASDRGNLCLIPGNEQAVVMAEELSKLLGLETVSTFPSAGQMIKNREYIIVRDVIHMSFELDSLTAGAVGAGARIRGAVSILDIRTGIGDTKNRVSLYTINLEKGISYRKEQV